MAMFILAACEDQSVKLSESQGLDTVEIFSGGKNVEGKLSQTLDPRLDAEELPNVDRSLYSHTQAGAIGITMYERSRQSKKKIHEYLKGKGGATTSDNKGTFGVTTYTAQAVWVLQGSCLAYEVQAIFVRNE